MHKRKPACSPPSFFANFICMHAACLMSRQLTQPNSREIMSTSIMQAKITDSYMTRITVDQESWLVAWTKMRRESRKWARRLLSK